MPLDQAVECFASVLELTGIGLEQGLLERRVECGEACFALLHEPDSFTKRFAAGVVASASDEVADRGFEVLAEIDAAGHECAPKRLGANNKSYHDARAPSVGDTCERLW